MGRKGQSGVFLFLFLGCKGFFFVNLKVFTCHCEILFKCIKFSMEKDFHVKVTKMCDIYKIESRIEIKG